MSVTIPRRYYGHFSAEPSTYNPFDDLPQKDIIHLFTCARAGCGNVEEKANTFFRCPKCMTRYCSQECYDMDHTTGSHKVKCVKFGVVRNHMEKILCKDCWSKRWTEISQPSGARSYILCYKCSKKESKLETELRDKYPKVMDDPDIIRIWFH